MNTPDEPPDPARPVAAHPLHLPCLAAALLVMLAGTIRPNLFTTGDGRADHVLLLLLCWAMSAGFVRGVGFVPAQRLWRLLLGAPACLLALLLGAARVWF